MYVQVKLHIYILKSVATQYLTRNFLVNEVVLESSVKWIVFFLTGNVSKMYKPFWNTEQDVVLI